MGGDSVDDVDLFVRVIDSFMNRYMRRAVLSKKKYIPTSEPNILICISATLKYAGT